MDDNQFVLNKNRESDSKECVAYTIFGDHDFIDDDQNPRTNDLTNCLAKHTISNSKHKYYIKVGAYGKIYNPMGLYSEGTSNKFLAKIGKSAWEFTEVNQKVFDMYVNFLRTKNQAWLNNAEREMN